MSTASQEDTRGKLIEFYTIYNPAKLASVEDAVKRYAGREGDLWAQLYLKYGVDSAQFEALWMVGYCALLSMYIMSGFQSTA